MKIGFYNENTAKNAPYVKVNGVTFYLSYETVVAVSYGMGLKVIKNYWGPTTGKHLNWISTEIFQEKIGTGLGNAISNATVIFWVSIDWTRLLVNG